jgi:PAS domain S-box-containing protein
MMKDERSGEASGNGVRLGCCNQLENSEALRASEEKFERAFEASPLPQVLIRTTDRAFVAVNEAFERCFGYSRDELIGKQADELAFFVRDSDRRLVARTLAAESQVRNQQLQVRTKSGAIRTVVWSVVVVSAGGEPTLLIVANDITELHVSARALVASESRFASAFMKSPLPTAIVRLADFRFVDVNEAFARSFGYEREELVGQSTRLHNFWVERRDRVATYRKFFAEGKLIDHPVRMLTRDGEQRDLLWTIERIDVAGESSIMIMMQDVTTRKRDEAALRASDARFRQLAENIREVFWLAEPDFAAMVYVSPAYESIWGRSVERLYADPDDWAAAIHPEDRERVFIAARKQIGTGAYEATYRIVRPDGGVRWIHDRGFPVHDDVGRVIRFAGFAEDITERRQLEDELRQTQKMESLGMLAGGVAHDFNNVLAVIASCNGLLADDTPADHANRELVDEIDAAVNRASGLTRQLLAFSRKQVTDPKVIELNAIVNETRKMLRRILGEDIVLSTSLEPDLGRVRVDPGYLVQVLMNLAVNARDAMPRGGTLVLRTRNGQITHEQQRVHPGAKPGPGVLLEVTDTGSGIPREVVERIFEPFFTTKAQGRGTGMGLAVVHGIIDQAGGLIEVDSQLGAGTTFRIFLPAVDEQLAPAEDIASSIARGTERILLVDDDDHVRRAAGRALRSRGYDVTEANGGLAALQALEASQCAFDLLLTDVVMPLMDGRQLAEAAQARCPALRVLYTSGYTDDAVVLHGVMQGQVDLLEKPFRIEALALKVRQVLDKTLPAESAAGLRSSQDASGHAAMTSRS